MNYYLGYVIEAVETEQGWVGIWHHQLVGRIEIQFFPNAQAALVLLMDLIDRDVAASSLMKLVDEWFEEGRLDELEHHQVTNSLVQSVLALLN